LSFSKKHGVRTFIAGMQSPYEMQQFMSLSDAVVVAYDPSIYCDSKTDKLEGYTYQAVISKLLGITPVNGELPVSLKK